MRFHIKVVPKSSRNRVAGWMDDVLKVCVTAAPERGKANAAVLEVLAEALAVPKERIRVVTGRTSPQKIIEIDGLTEPELHKRLGLKP
jgi:uncharacterized protein (TIGR00251 family)